MRPMPLRHIKIPNPIALKSFQGESFGRSMTFGDMLERLMSNPKWSESYAHAVAQRAILEAYKPGEFYMTLAEEDWKKLKEVVEHPAATATDNDRLVAMPGYGINPSLISQLVPLLAAIMDAGTEKPATVLVEKPEILSPLMDPSVMYADKSS